VPDLRPHRLKIVSLPAVHKNGPLLNVSGVVANGLCTQCGVCAAMCPHKVIDIRRDAHMRYFPTVVSEDPCKTRCKSLCVEVCAGIHEDPSLWSRAPIGADSWEDFTVGHVDSAWVGYSTDQGIRSRGTSGGLVIGLLTYLLESKKVDGVLTIGPNTKDPLQHDIKVVTTAAELADCWGSKYYPMPLGQAFRQLMQAHKKYAVVLLGCHMRSLRLMERRIARLRENIVLRVGLICGYCSGFKGMMDQAEDWGLQDVQSIRRIDYREGKWPGNVRIQAPQFDRRTVIYNFLARLPFTTNQRCMMCSDLMNETADVVVGDAWLRELTERKDEGWSVAAVRNRAAAELMLEAQRAGALHLEPIDVATVIRSQEKPMRYKKNALPIRMAFLARHFKTGLPDYDFTRFADGFRVNFWNALGNRIFLVMMGIFFERDGLRRAMYRFLPRRLINWWVRSVFLMIAHEGESSFLLKWVLNKDPAMNCDA